MEITDTTLARLLGNVEQAVRDLDKTLQRMADDHDALVTRVTKLEHSRSWLAGVWAAAGAFAGFVLSLFDPSTWFAPR